VTDRFRADTPAPSGVLAILAAAATLLAGSAGPLRAQAPQTIAACDDGGASAIYCPLTVAAIQTVQQGVGLAGAGGNAFVGSASTLGRRFGRVPRVALSGHLGFTRYSVPDLSPTGGDTGVTSPSAHGQVTVGVFNGLNAAPTVGGLFALDLFASVDAVFLPGSAGFQGNSVGWGYGARIGIFRESFTLPGITVTVGQTRSGGIELASDAPGGGGVEMDVVTTSVRGTVGKDLAGLGFIVGGGWDWYSADGVYTTPTAQTPIPSAPISNTFSGFESSRALFFGGVSRTFLVVQVAGEIGWARGTGIDDPLLTTFDPSEGSFFGAFSLRLTL
jgi:hypothetical protein